MTRKKLTEKEIRKEVKRINKWNRENKVLKLTPEQDFKYIKEQLGEELSPSQVQAK